MTEWWSSYFVEGWAEVVAHAIDPARTAAQVDRIQQLLGLEALDAATGEELEIGSARAILRARLAP